MNLEKAIVQEGQATISPIVLLEDSVINQPPLVSDVQESSLNVSTHREVISIHSPKSQLDEGLQIAAYCAQIILRSPNLTN